MSTALRKVKDTSRQVLDLMVRHGDRKGIVDWDSLDAKEPGWDNNLPSRKWARQTSHRMRYNGYFEKYREHHSNGNGSAGGVPAAAMAQASVNPFKPGSKSAQLLEYILKYGDEDGYVDYNRLDAEVPGWWKVCKTRSYALVAFSDIRKRDKAKAALLARNEMLAKGITPGALPAGKTQTGTNGTARDSVMTSEQMASVIRMQAAKEAAKQVQQILAKSRFCMQCGNDLLMQFQAAHFGAKLSKKDSRNG